MLHHVDQSKKYRFYSKPNGSALKSFKLGNSVYISRTLCSWMVRNRAKGKT